MRRITNVSSASRMKPAICAVVIGCGCCRKAAPPRRVPPAARALPQPFPSRRRLIPTRHSALDTYANPSDRPCEKSLFRCPLDNKKDSSDNTRASATIGTSTFSSPTNYSGYSGFIQPIAHLIPLPHLSFAGSGGAHRKRPRYGCGGNVVTNIHRGGLQTLYCDGYVNWNKKDPSTMIGTLDCDTANCRGWVPATKALAAAIRSGNRPPLRSSKQINTPWAGQGELNSRAKKSHADRPVSFPDHRALVEPQHYLCHAGFQQLRAETIGRVELGCPSTCQTKLRKSSSRLLKPKPV